jgi:hypothetical protein
LPGDTVCIFYRNFAVVTMVSMSFHQKGAGAGKASSNNENGRQNTIGLIDSLIESFSSNAGRQTAQISGIIA